MLFSLRQLEVFALIGRLGNVSSAADGLAMSQSAASTALAELERRAGRPLFDRLGKRLHLNETGRQLLPHALELLDRAGEIDDILRGKSGLGALKIGATLTIGNYLGPLLMEQYKRKFPQACISLHVENTQTVIARIANFEMDVALIEGECNDARLTIEPWLDDELVVFCGRSHKLAGQERVSLDRLLQEDWVVRETGSGTRQTLERALAGHWSRCCIDTELTHAEAIKRLVAGGRVIGCLSRLAVADEFAAARLIELPTPDLMLRRKFYILSNPARYQTAAIHEFLNICRGFRI